MNTDLKILNRLDDVTLLRCVAVISLVVWHTYCPIMWGDAWQNEFSGHYSWLFTRIIPDANMPLFTFIAGYLFSYQIANGKYADFKSFLNNKVHRLLIPFIILGAGINLLEYGKDISDMLYGGPNHLWYCLMLFYCYILCWLIEKRCGKWLNYILMIGSFCVALYYGSVWSLWHTHIPGGWEFLVFYYGYFYLGFILFNHRERLFDNWLSIPIILVLYLLTCAFHLPYFSIVPFRSIFYITLLFSLSSILLANRGGAIRTKQPDRKVKLLQFWYLCFPSMDNMECCAYPYVKGFHKANNGNTLYNSSDMFLCNCVIDEHWVDTL